MPEAIDSPLDQLGRSLLSVDMLIGNVRVEQWSARTPCEEWDVRRVVEHLVGMNRVFTAMLADEAPPHHAVDLPRNALPMAFRESGAALFEAFGRPGALDRSYVGPLGSATGLERLRIRLYDLLAHGWDIARATSQHVQLPDDAAEDALTFVREQLRDDARPGRFGAPQPVSHHAPAIEQLAAFLGRPVD